MGKKKPFIDKKKASSYTLLHRSQRDVADEGGVGEDDVAQQHHHAPMVLWSNERTTNLPSTDRAVAGGSSSGLTAWRAQLEAAGLVDVVDHERYLKPIGSGTFLDARTGKTTVLDTSTGYSHRVQQQQPQPVMEDAEDALLEVTRQFDSIPLTADCMDDDIAQVLFGDFEEGDFEELNDDFVLEAAAEPPLDDRCDNAGDGLFDFDEHIQRLMAKAAAERHDRDHPANCGKSNRWGQQDKAFFANCKPLHEQQDDDDDDDNSSVDPSLFRYGGAGTSTVATEPGVVAKLGPEEERALCEKFEATLAEYDSDDDGMGGGTMLADIPEEEIQGPRPLEGDAFVEAALDDFLLEKEDEIFIQGTRQYMDGKNRKGGSGFAVLVGTRMVPAKELDAGDDHPEQEPAQPIEELLAHAQQRLALPKERPPPEEIFIDGKSYFSERERNPFDCESILSTYSNLDNNPTTIGTTSRRRNRKAKLSSLQKKEDQESGQHIQLSAKTGLPVGVLNKTLLPADHYQDDEDVDDTFMSINRGEARNRNETPEEKRARKLLVKREREVARIQKKITRQVYAEEFQKRSVETDDAIAGKTVFRF